MLVHQQLRRSQCDLDKQLRVGEITVDTHCKLLEHLNEELKQAEQEMYSVAYGEQLNLLKFITGTVPDAFKKIHARFPHLTWDQVIEFEQTTRAAGGSIMTHSGNYILTHREAGEIDGSPIYDYNITWTCCHSIWSDYSCSDRDWPDKIYYVVKSDQNSRIYDGAYWCHIDPLTKIVRKRVGITQEYDGHWDIPEPTESPDLKNPNPLGRCESPAIFSLTDEFKVNDSITVAELKSATENRINITESEIFKMQIKLLELTQMLKTLNILTDRT